MLLLRISLLCVYAFFVEAGDEVALRINLFSSKNGKGLEASRQILKNELVQMGHIVEEKEWTEKKIKNCPQVDLNIFFERIIPKWLDCAAINWFIPNPEWYLQERSTLQRIDLILCRTHEVERIFNELNMRTYYIGFTSNDCFDPSIEKDFGLCLHVAGGSHQKGTPAIVKAWSERCGLNPVIILIQYSLRHRKAENVQWIQERLPLADLRLLQNGCGIHLCPSETEGFGHYLMEAMSTGAVVVTTDAPPMNEFIDDERCLVPYARTSLCRMATCYYVDSEQLAKKVEALMALSNDELKKMGEHNRALYLQKTEAFHENIKQLMLQEFP